MVVGDRQVKTIDHFSPTKKLLQQLGSWVVRRASSTTIPDAASGFRAYNREAALQVQVVSKFTYTLETLIQAGKQLVAVDHVPSAPTRRPASHGCSPPPRHTCGAMRSPSSGCTPNTSRCECSGVPPSSWAQGALAFFVRYLILLVHCRDAGAHGTSNRWSRAACCSTRPCCSVRSASSATCSRRSARSRSARSSASAGSSLRSVSAPRTTRPAPSRQVAELADQDRPHA